MVSTRSRTASKDSSSTPTPAAAPQKKRGAAEENASPRPAKKKPAAMEFAVGKPVVKDVTLRNQKDEDVAFSDTYKDQGVVFFMYPRANTPGCTKQACGASLTLNYPRPVFNPGCLTLSLSVRTLQASVTTSRRSRTRASRSTGSAATAPSRWRTGRTSRACRST